MVQNFPVFYCFLAGWIGLNLISGLLAQAPQSGTQTDRSIAFERSVGPLLEDYCFQCHGSKVQESDLRIDDLNPDLVNGKHAGQWKEILDALNRGDMPPEDAVQPSASEREVLIRWIETEIERAAKLARATNGHVTLRRMTRYEYNNTMRDLLGIDLDFSRDLPPDTRSVDGFKNNGLYMEMSDLQLQEYYAAAKRGLSVAIVEGGPIEPIYKKVTQASKGVRFDNLATATYDDALAGTVVSYSLKDPKKKKSKTRKNAMVLVCEEKLPPTGTFRVRIEASATIGEPQYSPPRMQVVIGHKTGVGIEPSKEIGVCDVRGKLGSPEYFEFTGRLEEFPLHTGKTIKKFPGLRVIITDANAIIPASDNRSKRKSTDGPVLENRPKLVIHSVEFQSPIEQTWPPPSHTQMLPAQRRDESDDSYLRSVLEKFISRAFRRPASVEEIAWATRYYAKVRPTTASFEAAIREVFALILVSPKFLYLPEFRADANESNRVPLTGYELASRLSYFLWATMPDQELIELAKAEKLLDNAVLGQQVERLLGDKRSWEFVKGFAGQWLDLDGVDSVAVNPEFFPDFDGQLKEDMKKESLHFFAEVLNNRLSCLNFLQSDFVTVNDRLAEFYGLEKPKSGDFHAVALPADSVRGGVLTQASFLLGNSTGAQSHPVYRATWFLDRIMGDPPGDPPADVPELEVDEESPAKQSLSLRRQLEEHRKRDACNRCHRNLDPWGIPFEQFDALGREIREGSHKSKQRKTQPVEKETILPDGTKINGSEELITYLLENKKRDFATGFTKHLLTFALGRTLEWSDLPLIDQLSAEFQANEFKLHPLITSIVQSDAFRTK